MLQAVRNADPKAIVAATDARYAATNPASREQFKRAARYLAGANTRVALHYDPFPIVVDHAAHGRVYDLDGHSYIDFMNDLTAGFYGHSDPAIIDALQAALARGISFGAPSVHEHRLAEAICTRFPSIEKVRFCNSGTEANLVAFQLARASTGRPKILAFSSGYHGSLASYLPGLTDLNVDSKDIVLARFNDAESARQAAATAGPALAAIVVEPMLGSGGTLLAESAFLSTLRTIASELGALLIFDEVQTARLSYGGLQEVFGIHADLTTLGKFVGGGLSFGAVGGRAELINLFDPTRADRIGHGGTFNNNILTMIAGHTGLEHVATREAIATLNQRSDRLRSRLQALAGQGGLAFQAGGYGSIVSIHFQHNIPRSPDEITTPALWRKLVHLEMLLGGIYATRRGTINLSLATSDQDCDAFVTRFKSIIDEYGDYFASFVTGH